MYSFRTLRRPYWREVGGRLLRIHLTGSLTVADGEHVVAEAHLPGVLGRVTLAVLAIERHPVPRHVLADRLWPGEPPERWDKSLAPIVSKLRTVLRRFGDDDGRPTIESVGGCYELLLPGGVWIDVEDAVRRLDRAEAAWRDGATGAAWADAAAASAVLRRPFLPGFDAPWVDRFRDDLRDRSHRAWMVLGRVWLERGDHALARSAANEAIGVDPYREDAHRLLIRIELDDGNRGSAAEAARRCERTLRDDLGVPPSAATAELIAAATGN